jgi:hypothetical protein
MNLTHQAMDATLGHAEAAIAPTSGQLAEIVDLEIGLSTAQLWDFAAGSLNDDGATGGPWDLSNQLYYPGINDSLGADPTGTAFTSSSMTLFNAWRAQHAAAPFLRIRNAARQDIAAGERLFNTFPIKITAVRGLNDNAALGSPAVITGTCTTCHDAPNVGHHSLPLPLDVGVGHTTVAGLENDPQVADGLAELDAPNLPVFEISGCAVPFSHGEPVSFYTTDPGKALVTGLCSDLNRLKGPVLRALAARAPYFHNGGAANLLQAVDFYDQRFDMKLTQEQKRQLVAFLHSL